MMTPEELMLIRADAFAEGAHASRAQLRKYVDQPYIEHPRAVARLIEAHGIMNHTIRAAALLHDVIEDTDIIEEDLARTFPAEVVKLVIEVTDVYTPGPGEPNRATRKAAECLRLSFVSPEAKVIKLADMIDNMSTIVDFDPKFADTYLREKRHLLPNLIAAGAIEGGAGLWHSARTMLDEELSRAGIEN